MDDNSHQIVEEVWDKKKIAVGLVIFLFLATGAFAAKSYFFPKETNDVNTTNNQSVKGIQTYNTDQSSVQTSTSPDQSDSQAPKFSLPSTDIVQEKLHQIQEQISQTNVVEIATSSPQVQDIIKEIQALPQVPGNEAKATCIDLCNKL